MGLHEIIHASNGLDYLLKKLKSCVFESSDASRAVCSYGEIWTEVFGRCILLFLECLSFHSGLTVILAQWLLLRRLGPVSLSLTTKMTIQRWWFHHFIQTFSGTNREHSSYIYLCPNIFCDSQNICYTTQVFCHITCDRWSLVMASLQLSL